MPRDPRDTVFEDRVRVEHMLKAACEIVEFARTRDRKDLDDDRMFFRAVVHAILEIGEAARCVSEVGRARAPSIPWPQVVGIRHVFVHVYWGINPDKLWTTVTDDIPPLIRAIESALNGWPPEAHEDA